MASIFVGWLVGPFELWKMVIMNNRAIWVGIAAFMVAVAPTLSWALHGSITGYVLMSVICAPTAMWLSFCAHKLAPQSIFFKTWFPALLVPVAFQLWSFPVFIWVVSRPSYSGPWP